MYSADPAGELRDLQERYARMADEELEALAHDAYQLTEIAHDALRSEIRSRKLNFTLRDAPEPVSDMAPEREGFDPANSDLVEVQRVWSMDDAVAPIEYRCPKCKSDEIVFEELEKESEDQPDFQATEHWHCDACGHKWIEDT